MKDFLPLFMSSLVFDYICYRAQSLWWMNVCLLQSVQVIECVWEMVLLWMCLPLLLRPFLFYVSLTAALVGKSLFDSQNANNFPAALPSFLCRFFLLSPCLRCDQIAETKDLWRTCFASSLHTSLPITPTLICSLSTWRASNKTKEGVWLRLPWAWESHRRGNQSPWHGNHLRSKGNRQGGV